MHTSELNRFNQAVSKPARRSIKNVIRLLEKELEELDTALLELIQSDERLKQIDDIIQSIPGIGRTTSAALIALLPELGTLNRQTVAALAGLAPYAHESGNFK